MPSMDDSEPTTLGGFTTLGGLSPPNLLKKSSTLSSFSDLGVSRLTGIADLGVSGLTQGVSGITQGVSGLTQVCSSAPNLSRSPGIRRAPCDKHRHESAFVCTQAGSGLARPSTKHLTRAGSSLATGLNDGLTAISGVDVADRATKVLRDVPTNAMTSITGGASALREYGSSRPVSTVLGSATTGFRGKFGSVL